MKKLSNFLSLNFIIIFLEAIFNIFVLSNINLNFIYVLLFSTSISLILSVVTNLFNKKVNHVLNYIVLISIITIFISQFVYNKVYLSVISIFSIVNGGGGQVAQFANQIISVLKGNWYVILLFFLPLILYIILDKLNCFKYERFSLKKDLLFIFLGLMLNFGAVFSFKYINNNELYSSYNLYNKVHAPLLTVDKIGLLSEMRLDLKRYVFGFVEKDIELPIIGEKPVVEEETEYGYNSLEIDFDSLINNESDSVIKQIDEYISTSTPSMKNEYTGLFAGKNLIVFVAEAFSNIAINEEITPTLYKLYSEGFQFDNFYTPLFPVSTADGEYITDTSLIPKEGVWSLSELEGNFMPYSYANIFENLGYTSQAYHDNTATYYKRNKYITAMGYDSFKACKAGLNINCKIWPESDLEMIDASYTDYINDEKFLAYYMTVSGHLEYTRLGNMMVTKNWDYVKNLDLSDKAKSYLASQKELDKAVAETIKLLSENNKLDDTVIVISGDHYPYGLTLDEVNELSSYERDENFELHHMPLLIWNSTMENSIKVTKYASSLDVLPTVLNLFGIDFDSRLLMGRDILSNSEGLVIFSNRSFITSSGKYNAVTKKFLSFNENEVDDNYINKVSSIIYNKYKYSRLILENDYYRSLYERLGLEIK